MLCSTPLVERAELDSPVHHAPTAPNTEEPLMSLSALVLALVLVTVTGLVAVGAFLLVHFRPTLAAPVQAALAALAVMAALLATTAAITTTR